ncbi:MAG: T9SS type A sorting domain-containing protein [Bacteroidia bacterium]
MKNKIILSLLLSSTIALAQDGSLDLSFGTGGKVTTAIGTTNDIANAVAVQTDGKIVVAGGSGNFALARYNVDGSLDISFDTDGKVSTTVGTSSSSINDVAIQADGKIIAVGYSYTSGGIPNITLVRYNIDGSLDLSFDTDGIVTTPNGTANSIAIQTDGKIIVTGSISPNLAVVRYTTNGSLDNTFDTDGIVTTYIGFDGGTGNDVAIQTDGKIVVAGYRTGLAKADFALVRYTTNGSLDGTFDTDGIVTTAVGTGYDYGFALAIQADGKIVETGYSHNSLGNYDIALCRYAIDGSLDTAFNTDGILTTTIGTNSSYGKDIAIQADGKIIVAGYTNSGLSKLDFIVGRYVTNGNLDPSFDTDGIVTTAVGATYDEGHAMAIQPNGKIIVVGSSNNGANNDFAIVRYNNDCIATTYNLAQSICAGQSISIGNNTYNLSGTYIDTLTSASTCDSIVITTLTVHQLPVMYITYSSPASTECEGSMDTVIVTGNAISYLWSTGEINDTLFLNHNIGDTNVVSVTGTDSLGCTNTVTYSLGNVDPLLSYYALITGITDSLCVTDSARVLTFITGNGTWSGTGIIGNMFNPSIAGVGIHSITYMETYPCGVSVIEANVRVDACTVGLNKLTIANATISPNPNNGTFSITTPNYGTYTIVNELGQTVYKFTTTTSSSTININGLASGVYVVKNNATAGVTKIVVTE